MRVFQNILWSFSFPKIPLYGTELELELNVCLGSNGWFCMRVYLHAVCVCVCESVLTPILGDSLPVADCLGWVCPAKGPIYV